MKFRKLDLLVSSYLKLRYKSPKTEEDFDILKKQIIDLSDNQELWEFVSLADSSVVDESFLISQKLFITAALLYLDADDITEKLLFLLELLEKRLRVPSFLTTDYLLIIVDLRTMIAIYMMEDNQVEKDALLEFFLAPLPSDSLIHCTDSQAKELHSKLSVQSQTVFNSDIMSSLLKTLIEEFRLDCAAILVQVLVWSSANEKTAFSPPKSSLNQRTPEIKRKNYAPAVLEKRSYASPSKVTPSVSKDIPLLSVGKSPSAKDHDHHFSMDIDYELPFVHLEREHPLSVAVGSRFFDANLRKYALDTFVFRPIPDSLKGPLGSIRAYASPAAHLK